jgi:hypothetical protein
MAGGMWHIEGRREMHRGITWRKHRERSYLEDLRVDRRIILKSILKEWD